MSVSNLLQNVQTWNKGGLAFLQNVTPMISTMNTKFDNFQNITANLGTSVAFDKQPRFQAFDSLVVTFTAAVQRIQTLTVDQQRSIAYEFTNQERLFNVDKSVDSYLPEFSKGAVVNLGTQVEKTVALSAVSGMVSQITNQPNYLSGPFRFYGDGRTSINTFGQMATAMARFHDFGSPPGDLDIYLPVTAVPSIVNSGLNQFALSRNNEMAMSWEVGSFGSPRGHFYQSNQLPTHIAGTVGQETGAGDNILTVISTNDPTGANITQITFSGASDSDADAIKYGDVFEMQLGVSGIPDVFFGNYITGARSNQPVQFRATADTESDGSGHIVVNIYPGLQITPSQTDNMTISRNIIAGMKAKVMDSHVAGLIVGGKGFFLALPRLPEQVPFPTSVETDETTGVSMRLTYGTLFGQNQQGFTHDLVFGATLVPEYCMRLLFPLSSL